MKLTSPRATILAAVIAVLGIVVGAFLNPLAMKLINQPEPTPIPTSLALEQIPQEIFRFAGSDTNQGGLADFRFLYDTNLKPSYILIFDLPKDQFGSAGLAFRFDKSINLSEYKSIAFTIRFEEANVSMDLFLTDITDAKASTRIVSADQSAMDVSFPLNNFTAIDLNALKEINFYSETSINTGHHKVVITNVRFTK